jgi:hypothetical protein
MHCFYFYYHGKRIKICVPVYYAYDPFHKPEPDPRFRLEFEDISEELVLEAIGIAQIRGIAMTVANDLKVASDLKQGIMAAVDQAVEKINAKMPKDVTMRFE